MFIFEVHGIYLKEYLQSSGERFHLNLHVWIVDDATLDNLLFYNLMEENYC